MVEKKITLNSQHEQNLTSLLKHRLAGNPDDAGVLYTDLSPAQLSNRMNQLGTPVSHEPIRQWMTDQKLRLRGIHKVLSCGQSADRDAQFQRIAELIEDYKATGNPYSNPRKGAYSHDFGRGSHLTSGSYAL